MWLPLLCSVVLEAVAGARAGAARHGRPLTPQEAGRLSLVYSAGLALLSAVLGVWIIAARPAGSPAPVIAPGQAAAALVAFVVGTVLRWRLMIVFAPRRA
jgi:hypothetical protein